MNEYLQLVVVIVDSQPILPPPEDLNKTMSIQDIEALELRMSSDIDATVRVFARSRRWPTISQKESYFLRHRMKFGKLVADSLAAPNKSSPVPRPSIFPRPPEDFWLDSQLEWLLVSAWEHVGRGFWIDHGLYGLPPGDRDKGQK